MSRELRVARRSTVSVPSQKQYDSDTDEEEEGSDTGDARSDKEGIMTTYYEMQRRRIEREASGGQVHGGSIGVTIVLLALAIIVWMWSVLHDLYNDRQRFYEERVELIKGHRCAEKGVQFSCVPFDIPSVMGTCAPTQSVFRSDAPFMIPAEGAPISSSECYCCVIPPEGGLEYIIGESDTSWDIQSVGYQYLPKQEKGSGRKAAIAIAWNVAILGSVAAFFYVVANLYFRPSIEPLHYIYIGGCVICCLWFILFTIAEDSPWINMAFLQEESSYLSSGQETVAEIWFWFTIWSLGTWWFLRKVVPHFGMAACNMQKGASWLNAVREEDCSDGRIRYSHFPHSIFTAWRHKRRYITYEGELDAKGRPHGRGEWSENSSTGECLSGIWVNGRPIRQFRSRTSTTFSQFLQRPIGYATHRYDCPDGNLKKAKCCVRRAPARYGVVHVECSVAGGFFKFLPKIRDEENLGTADEMINTLLDRGFNLWTRKALDPSGSGKERKGFDIPTRDGFQPSSDESPHEQLDRPKEALVYIHGWSADMATALTKASLMLTLGKCKEHIVPFVFGWSAGNVASIFTQRRHTREYAPDFIAFFKELQRHFREVHVITHSMGAHVWLQNFALISDCFIPSLRQGPPHPNDPRLHLATVTMMNANALVEEFVLHLPHMAKFTEKFTFYQDTNDVATKAEEVFVSSLMPRSWQTWRDQDLNSRSINWDRYAWPVSLVCGRDGEYELRGRAVAKAMRDEDLQDADGSGQDSTQSAGCFGNVRPGQELIDIVDCTHLQANAGGSRHNYYALNPLMVEDVCELLSDRRAAFSRSHLIQRQDNVFDFLSAPKDVKA